MYSISRGVRFTSHKTGVAPNASGKFVDMARIFLWRRQTRLMGRLLVLLRRRRELFTADLAPNSYICGLVGKVNIMMYSGTTMGYRWNNMCNINTINQRHLFIICHVPHVPRQPNKKNNMYSISYKVGPYYSYKGII